MSHNEVQPNVRVLHGIDVPERHSNTWFCDMEAGLAALPTELRERIAGLSRKHDATRNSAGELRAGFAESYTPEDLPSGVRPRPTRSKPAS